MKLSASDRVHQVSLNSEAVFILGSDAEEEFKHYNQGIKWNNLAFSFNEHFNLIGRLMHNTE